MRHDESWWSVAVQVPPTDLSPMWSRAALMAWPVGDVRSMRFSDVAKAPDKHSLVTADIRARSRHDAGNYARSVVADMRQAVGLEELPLSVEWVAPLGDNEASSYRFSDGAFRVEQRCSAPAPREPR